MSDVTHVTLIVQSYGCLHISQYGSTSGVAYCISSVRECLKMDINHGYEQSISNRGKQHEEIATKFCTSYLHIVFTFQGTSAAEKPLANPGGNRAILSYGPQFVWSPGP